MSTGILAQIQEIETEMARTQKNKVRVVSCAPCAVILPALSLC